jgi:protein phosphatase-4 regulatory subunit 3
MVNRIPDADDDEFLSIFYEKYATRLLFPIYSLEKLPKKTTEQGVAQLLLNHQQLSILNHICDLIAFMIRYHETHSKYFIISNTILPKLIPLFSVRAIHIQLATLRIFRVCIGLKDSFFVKNLLKFDIFKHILTLMLSAKSRDNLLRSACLELFQFIRVVKFRTRLYLIGKFKGYHCAFS